MTPRIIAAVAVADFRDRVRRPAFLVVLAAAVGLGYLAAPPAAAGYTMVKIGAYRGVYDSGYLGAMFSLVGTLWLSLCGFYLVKNAITRDATSGVGQVLASTRVGTATYLLGKFLSNLLVLASMAGALAATAPVMQLLRGESRSLDPVALWLPFLLLCLPVLALTAALALLFESIRPLSGGFGNVTWFFAFLAMFVGGLATAGMTGIADGLRADLLAQHPETVQTEISIGLTSEADGLGRFVWSGLDITPTLVGQQVGYLIVAVLLATAPALWFARFDTSRQRRRGSLRAIPAVGAGAVLTGVAPGGALPMVAAPPGVARAVPAGRPRTAVHRGGSTRGLVSGEVSVLLRGNSRWWWLGLLAITVAGLAVPSGTHLVLLVAWIWPLLLWSRLGTQAHEHGVHLILDAAMRPSRRLLAEWTAGVVVAALAGAGPLARMLLAGDIPGAAAWLGGALFIPALAVLLGGLSRSPRLFQLVYLAIWYALVNAAPAVDVMGAVRVDGRPAGPHPLLVLACGAILLTTALATLEIRHARR